jgi:EmrB/QacA subfamily drug resistance transporter
MRTDASTQRWVLGLAALASFMVSLDALVVSTALTTIRLDLDASFAELEWTVTAYVLPFAVLLMSAAALGDRFGRRRMLVFGLLLFVAASAACALAPSAGWLIAARVVQGAGAAFVLPLATALVGTAFPPERRGVAMGRLQGLTGLAVAGGPLVGGAIVEGLPWEWIFVVNVPLGLVAAVLLVAKAPESTGAEGKLDPPGIALVTAAAFGVVWGLVRGNEAGWGSAEVLLSLAAGVLLVGAFVAWERRAPAPMLPLGLFRSRQFSAGNLALLFGFASLYVGVFLNAQFLQLALGHGPLATGLMLLPWTATLLVVAPIAGRNADRVGERRLAVGGLLLNAIGFLWIALVAEPGMSYLLLVPGAVLAGVGFSAAMPAAQIAVVRAASIATMGKAAGTASMTRQLGGVVGVAVGAAVFAATGSFASPQAVADGFGPAIAAGAGFGLLAAAAALAIPARVAAPPAPTGPAPAPALAKEGVAG